MAKIWVTYAWADNKDKDVDFIAQELENAGLEVKLDRWNIGAGKRLWEQIESFICDSSQSDAWMIYATQNSLGSEACKEEYSYALDRALENRESGFPIIGVFPASVDKELIPAGIRTRLYISITDPDWKERIKAAAEGKEPDVSREPLEPYYLKIHSDLSPNDTKYIIEMRPRAGSWLPFFAAVPANEKDRIAGAGIPLPGPAGTPPKSFGMFMHGPPRLTADGLFWAMYPGEEATPTKSYYLSFKELPSELVFGVANGKSHKVIFNNASATEARQVGLKD